MWMCGVSAAAPRLRLPAAARPSPPSPPRRPTTTKNLHLPSAVPFLKGSGGICFLSGSSSFPSTAAGGGTRSGTCRRLLLCYNGGATAALWQDAGATALVMAGAYSLVLGFEALTQRNLIDQKLSRKIVHVLSGILFMFSWPIFSASVEARFFAAMVPLVNCLRLTIYGLCLATDEGLIKSVTREGKPEELLRGPLYYVLVLMFCALAFWRDSPVGVVSLAMMSGGDGVADIMGRRFGRVKLPHNSRKSWTGSICMFISGFFISIGMLYYFSALGYIHLDWREAVGKVALVSLAATVVESLPITDILDDNISVPLSSMFTAFLVFGHGH